MMDELAEYLRGLVDGETPGDTLKRFADMPMIVFVDPQGNDELNKPVTDAWRDWLRDLGDRLNKAMGE